MSTIPAHAAVGPADCQCLNLTAAFGIVQPVLITMRNSLKLAFSKDLVLGALLMAVIVGPILVLINQGQHVLGADGAGFSWIKAGLTFLVPYCVSIVSGVTAIRSRGRQDR